MLFLVFFRVIYMNININVFIKDDIDLIINKLYMLLGFMVDLMEKIVEWLNLKYRF